MTVSTIKEREYSIDLFRCLGLLFVNGLHAFLYNGFYDLPQTGIWVWLANAFRWLFYGCSGMFMVMTGYLKSTKPWDAKYYKGLLTVLVGYLLTCVVSYPIRYFLLGEKDEIWVWIQRLVTFSNYAWYVKMYIGLVLVSPIINLAFNQIRHMRGILAIVLSLFALSALPDLVGIPGEQGYYSLFPDYWTSLYPLTYYAIGAAIRRWKPKIPSGISLICALLIAIGLGTASILTATDGFSSGISQGYGGFWVALMVTALFLGIYRLPVGSGVGKALSWVSGGVLEGFILSRLLDVWVYDLVAQWHSPEKYPLVFLCVTVPVFLVSLLVGRAIHTLSGIIVNKK